MNLAKWVTVIVICVALPCLTIAEPLAQDSSHPPINRLKELLKSGKPAIGVMVVMPTAASVEVLAALGFDWVLIDSEHGPIDIEPIHHMVRATNGTNTAPI